MNLELTTSLHDCLPTVTTITTTTTTATATPITTTTKTHGVSYRLLHGCFHIGPHIKAQASITARGIANGSYRPKT